MIPRKTGAHYDQIAGRWQAETNSAYGVAQLERAIGFSKIRGPALDVGCGSTGRFLRVLEKSGFQPEGLDVSEEMIFLASERTPSAIFYPADISGWALPKSYAFISAWDSTFHLPLSLQ